MFKILVVWLGVAVIGIIRIASIGLAAVPCDPLLVLFVGFLIWMLPVLPVRKDGTPLVVELLARKFVSEHRDLSSDYVLEAVAHAFMLALSAPTPVILWTSLMVLVILLGMVLQFAACV